MSNESSNTSADRNSDLDDELRTEYAGDETDGGDFPGLTAEHFKNPAAGEHYLEMMRRSNLVRIEETIAKHFPSEKSVNEALRVLIDLRQIVNKGKEEPLPKPVKKKKTA